MGKAKSNHLYPGNARKLRDIKLPEYPKPLFRCPSGAEGVMLTCECGHRYPPPWTETLHFEFTQIQSADGGLWAVSGLPFHCPACGHENTLNFPEPETVRGKVTLFGDEASQWFNAEKSLLYVFAFINLLDGAPRERVREMMHHVRRTIRPNDDPSSWPFHTSDIRDERWRRKHRVDLDINEINQLLRELAASLAAPEDGRWIGVTVMPGARRESGWTKHQATEKAREVVLTAALTIATDELTRQGFSINFAVEARKDDHRRNHIEYDVERVARSLRHNLTYLYVSRCRLIGLPTTEPKGASLELEIADLVAFMTRRYFHCANIKRRSEIDLESLGRVVWCAFTPDGRVGTKEAIGFPWDHFYPNVPMRFE